MKLTPYPTFRGDGGFPEIVLIRTVAVPIWVPWRLRYFGHGETNSVINMRIYSEHIVRWLKGQR